MELEGLYENGRVPPIAMPSFQIPRLRMPRFHRLHSFHLSPTDDVPYAVASQAPVGGTITLRPMSVDEENRSISPPISARFPIPIRGSAIVTLALVTALFFIASISLTFLGANADESYFKRTLNTLAGESPGVVLLGENVDVDVDKPSVTIRWTIVACGPDYTLPGSYGIHESNLCGLPAFPIHFFVDSDETPTAKYDPSKVPFEKDTRRRRSVQNLIQFDSDHVLDVHEAFLYPFDTYKLSSTIRASSPVDNTTIQIHKIITVDITASFDISSADTASHSTPENGTELASRDIDILIRRPNSARFFTLLLFTMNWVLAQITVGNVFIARRVTGVKSVFPRVVSSGAILIVIPQIRNAMPDAPGLDGVLIDSIGFFLQMIIVGLSTISLLLILIVREIDDMQNQTFRARPSEAQSDS